VDCNELIKWEKGMKIVRTIVFFISLLITGTFFGCAPTSNEPIVPGRFIDNSNPRATLILGSEKLLNKVKIINPIFRTLGQLTQN